MNIALDFSSIEALAFNYLDFGCLALVNNLWAWVTVMITAALSFWRIRATASAVSEIKEAEPKQLTVTQPSIDNQESTKSVIGNVQPVASVWACDPLSDGTTKGGKFTEYYREELNETSDYEEELTVVTKWGRDRDGCYNGGLDRVLMMRIRMGDMGWYRCQDLTAINGNVVRLWNDNSRRNETYSASCIIAW